jgi:ribosomal protein L29
MTDKERIKELSEKLADARFEEITARGNKEQLIEIRNRIKEIKKEIATIKVNQMQIKERGR